ncbi:MAG: DUF402 domain-containing protein [Actinomycetota bacterium]
MFRPGDPALFRFVWPWKVFSAVPTTVVEHTAARVALWLAPETPVRRPPGGRHPISRLASGDWVHAEDRWYGARLMLAEPTASHSVYVRWNEAGEFVGWYVNLEDPWRESPFGFDTTDHLLDIWVDPDRSWRWKDEDHLAEALAGGLFTAEQANAMRAEGERVVERIEAWSAPFDEGWETWLPDPDWPLPSIPNGWEKL